MSEQVIASTESQNEEWVLLCKTSDVPSGEIATAKHPGGLDLAIYNVDGEYYVTSDRCTHGAASLYDEGELRGHVVECAWHNGTFDVRTGAALTMPCRVPLRSFETKVVGDELYIQPRPRRFKAQAAEQQ